MYISTKTWEIEVPSYEKRCELKELNWCRLFPDKDYIMCDDLIAPLVSEFNKHGFLTLYSCAGHHEDEQPYIMIYGFHQDFIRAQNPELSLLSNRIKSVEFSSAEISDEDNLDFIQEKIGRTVVAKDANDQKYIPVTTLRFWTTNPPFRFISQNSLYLGENENFALSYLTTSKAKMIFNLVELIGNRIFSPNDEYRIKLEETSNAQEEAKES